MIRNQKKIINHLKISKKARENLFKNKDFPMCIATSVLIIEEIAKLHMIVHHMRSKKPIGETEWNSMMIHKQKLTKPFQRLKKKTREMDLKRLEKILNDATKSNSGTELMDMIEFIQKLEPEIEKSLKLYDKMKQDCFYVSNRKGKLFSISTDLAIKQQEDLAFFMKNQSETMLQGVLMYFDKESKGKDFNNHLKKFKNKQFLEKDMRGHSIFEKYYYE